MHAGQDCFCDECCVLRGDCCVTCGKELCTYNDFNENILPTHILQAVATVTTYVHVLLMTAAHSVVRNAKRGSQPVSLTDALLCS